MRCDEGRNCLKHCEICCYDENGKCWEDHEMWHRYEDERELVWEEPIGQAE